MKLHHHQKVCLLWLAIFAVTVVALLSCCAADAPARSRQVYRPEHRMPRHTRRWHKRHHRPSCLRCHTIYRIQPVRGGVW